MDGTVCVISILSALGVARNASVFVHKTEAMKMLETKAIQPLALLCTKCQCCARGSKTTPIPSVMLLPMLKSRT